eukprot:CAMPEP_0174334000 /NCGR_PEP_ID=MMETSP0810-20121108/19596_1 /TAXON_ID=73025 ORGANISM="Eutreptiella gymnastica-like, Strain CCMP1594" /NCGR_SAMPLE_ID=MMETSP0810 /ASSEMBLY_ACC=CAM_ASM_000659 /LENGTH=77 /DNA_ID=CAMNT_0015451443 /DNA_START=249 /DNA_END=482 /DNA_ORIENTATION=-
MRDPGTEVAPLLVSSEGAGKCVVSVIFSVWTLVLAKGGEGVMPWVSIGKSGILPSPFWPVMRVPAGQGHGGLACRAV